MIKFSHFKKISREYEIIGDCMKSLCVGNYLKLQTDVKLVPRACIYSYSDGQQGFCTMLTVKTKKTLGKPAARAGLK